MGVETSCFSELSFNLLNPTYRSFIYFQLKLTQLHLLPIIFNYFQFKIISFNSSTLSAILVAPASSSSSRLP